MRIFKVTRSDEIDYDGYVGFVCIAKTAEEAALIHPGNMYQRWNGHAWQYKVGDVWKNIGFGDSWVDPNTLIIEMVGKAPKSVTKERVLLSSYNAG